MIKGLAKVGSLIVSESALKHPPESFMRRLQAIFGREMHAEWNPRKERWVIEQCTEHSGLNYDNGIGYLPHNHLCRRIYVWLVRDENDNDAYMPLCDRVIQKLQEMDTTRKYGTGEAALQRFIIESKNIDEERDNKYKQNVAETMRYARRHNRTLFNKFFTMFQRHDLRPNQ